MYARTTGTLDELDKADWFSRVGSKDADNAEVLANWDAAIASCSSSVWRNLTLEAVNQYAARLSERSPAEYARWNDVVLDVRPAALSLVRRKTESIIRDESLPKIFLDTVAWDVLHVCVESEFADIYPPGFFASNAYWYVRGHFPCGWLGPFPEGGRLVIF